MRTSHRRLFRHTTDVTGSIAALIAVVLVCAFGVAGLPALGSALNPGTGVWHLAPEATGPARSGAYTVPGLHGQATVAFDSTGVAHISTSDDNDLWRAIGFVQAHFRLSQMDLARRQAEGRLAAVLGPSAVDSDAMELRLGLLRAARRDWEQLPEGSVRDTLTAYSEGVNTAIGQLTAAGELPTPFKLLGYRPNPWTPVDTLAIQHSETQALSFSDSALMYSYAAGALDQATFHSFFPVVPANSQSPYDPGPYRSAPLTPLPVGADPASAVPGSTAPGGTTPAAPAPATPTPTTAATATPAPSGSATSTQALGRTAGIGQLLSTLSALPTGEVHDFAGSNAWAVSGALAAGGKPLLAGDPHLDFNLPSIWYVVEGTSPGYHFQGTTIPGTPVPLIGRTDSFSWSITDSQRPTSLFYLEKTDPAHPNSYYWNGAWRPMETITDRIEVKGEPDVLDQVRLTTHGPVIQLQGVTASLWWAGTLPSQNVGDILDLLRAHDYTGFKESLRSWAAPSLNFVYADRAGHIGSFNVGVAPQVPGHDIGLPLPGDGSADVTGSIAYDQLPNSYDPPSGYVVSANQREVTGDYPYQYSTSYNFVDQGYRADEITGRLSGAHGLTAADFQKLQTDEHDQLAAQLVPQVVRAMAGQPMSALEQQVLGTLSGWDADMSTTSAAPTVSQALVLHLVYLVASPWWAKFGVPADPKTQLAPQPFASTPTAAPLTGTVLNWIQHDPTNTHLTPPGAATPRDAAELLRQDFHETVAHLAQQSGKDPHSWLYGKRHSVLFQSLLQASPLDRGPYVRGGDTRTINAAEGGRIIHGKADTDVTTGGASWRFVMDWSTGQGAGIYPGGQSESPLSPWYDNGIPLWLDGRLWPMAYGATGRAQTRSAIWRLNR